MKYLVSVKFKDRPDIVEYAIEEANSEEEVRNNHSIVNSIDFLELEVEELNNKALNKYKEWKSKGLNKRKNIANAGKELKKKLSSVKLNLHDAPIEVKEAFNTVVEYFTKSFNPDKYYVLARMAKVVLKVCNSEKEANDWVKDHQMGKIQNKIVIKGSDAIKYGIPYKHPDEYQG